MTQLAFRYRYYTGQETQVWLNYAVECRYIDNQTYESLDNKYDHFIAMLVNMSSKPENWSW
jgi:four helix bundle protein